MAITKHLFLLLFVFAALPALTAQVDTSRPAPPPPPPPSEPSWAEETYRLVGEMPRFPGCEDMRGEERRGHSGIAYPQ